MSPAPQPPDADADAHRRPAVVFVLNGPNLNMLGAREPEIYGATTLDAIETRCRDHGASLGLTVICRQSNHEGALVDWIQETRAAAAGLVLNAGAYTHTSIALHDAIRASETPTIEVHLSNIHAREPFRSRSFIAPAAIGMIAGLGVDSYLLAIDALHRRIAL